jgi:hypothetical protein
MVILLSTTIHISGLNDAACILATPGFAHPITVMLAGSLLTCRLSFSQVGFELVALTYWVTSTIFNDLSLSHRFGFILARAVDLLDGTITGGAGSKELV